MNATPKVLADCANVLSSEFHEAHQPPFSLKYQDHPDVKFFSSIKEKNHFEYHSIKSKTNSLNQAIPSAHNTTFNPSNRQALLKRIWTFNVVNWNIPRYPGGHDILNELICACHGWKCIDRNKLECTSCHQRLTLKFNELGGPNVPYDFSESDLEELNTTLMESYSSQIKKHSHESNCLWRHYKTNLEGIYYLTPNVLETNEILIGDYLQNFKELVDNSVLMKTYKSNFMNVETFDESIGKLFMQKTNHLLQQFFPDNSENYGSQLSAPSWFYKVALLGWGLRVQTYSNKSVLLLTCKNCNARVYLHSIDELNSKLSLENSKYLTPCSYPVSTHETQPLSIYEETYTNDELKINIFDEHKAWCSHLHTIDGKVEEKYIIEQILTDKNCSRTKRRASFDIEDGLERLNKLKKVYLIDY